MKSLVLSRFFKSLAHPTRVKIVCLLQQKKQLDFSEILKNFDYSVPTIANHLKVLTRTGAVKKTKRRKNGTVLYSLDSELFAKNWADFWRK